MYVFHPCCCSRGSSLSNCFDHLALLSCGFHLVHFCVGATLGPWYVQHNSCVRLLNPVFCILSPKGVSQSWYRNQIEDTLLSYFEILSCDPKIVLLTCELDCLVGCSGRIPPSLSNQVPSSPVMVHSSWWTIGEMELEKWAIISGVKNFVECLFIRISPSLFSFLGMVRAAHEVYANLWLYMYPKKWITITILQ